MENQIGKQIAKYRKQLGLTQEKLGEMVGVSGQAVSKWENGGVFVLSIDKNQDEFIDIGTSRVEIFPDTPKNIVCCLNKAGFHLSEQFETEFAHIFVAKKLEKIL